MLDEAVLAVVRSVLVIEAPFTKGEVSRKAPRSASRDWS